MGGLLGTTVYFIFVSGLILFLAFIVTRFIGTRYMSTLKGKNITILESTSLGIDKVLYLVKIGNEYMLISASGKNINFLKEIQPSNINYDMATNQEKSFQTSGFALQLEKFKEKFSSNKTMKKQSVNQQIENGETIDNNVMKVREMFNKIKVSESSGVENNE